MHIARLLLALMLVCNLTLCISWQAQAAGVGSVTDTAQAPAAMQTLPCHGGDQAEASPSPSQGDCQMHDGLSPGGAGLSLLAALLTLFALPLLLMPRPGATGSLLDQWLRDPLLRLRGTHPPSWPRRHLMLSVLRH
jgi:hypothetical protein